MMARLIDEVGNRHGRLTVLERGENAVKGQARWLCVCDCGNRTVVTGADLRNGHTTSCGCWKSEVSAERMTTHGLSSLPEYRTWKRMRTRCPNPNIEEFDYYGGRGIEVCPEWEDFEAFYRDVGPRPSAKHTIDRINTNGNYEPGNCRWATRKRQARNTRRNLNLTLHGETHTIAGWSEIVGIKQHALAARVRRGWSVDRVLTTPVAGVIRRPAD